MAMPLEHKSTSRHLRKVELFIFIQNKTTHGGIFKTFTHTHTKMEPLLYGAASEVSDFILECQLESQLTLLPI